MMFLECVSVAILAWTFSDVLTAPGHLFEFWYNWQEKLSNAGWPMLAKPLGYCGICFSGQCGLWWYAIAYRSEWVLGEHIVFVSQVIAFFLVIKRFAAITDAWLSKLKKG